MTTVNLSADEVRICTMLATERWLTKRNSADRPNYAEGKAAGRLEHELLSNIRANVVEYAVSKHFALPWTTPWYPNEEHPRRKNHPDVGVKTEVRSLRTRTDVPVWDKDIDKDATIVAGKCLDPENFSVVEIYGWIRAVDCKRPEWFDEQSQAWRVPITALTEGRTNG